MVAQFPQPGAYFKHLMSRLNWNVEVLIFVEGGKPESPEKNPWIKDRTNSKLNPHEMLSTGIERGSQHLSAVPLVLPICALRLGVLR